MSDPAQSRTPAQDVAEFLQGQERDGLVFNSGEYDGRAILSGFVVISEWIDESGSRWLSRLHGNGDGSRTLPDWQVEGYLHNALHSASQFDGDGGEY